MQNVDRKPHRDASSPLSSTAVAGLGGIAGGEMTRSGHARGRSVSCVTDQRSSVSCAPFVISSSESLTLKPDHE